jgi:DNA polymerase-4
MQRLHVLTLLVEQISIDEAFLDVTALGAPGADIAAQLQVTIRDELALSIVPPGEEALFLAPLPTTALWGVGPKAADKLAALGIHSIGDIAA